MPDKDNKTLINEALKSTKILDMYPKAAKELTEKLQKYFRDKNVALKVVTKDIKDGNNTLAGYEGQVADAEKRGPCRARKGQDRAGDSEEA